MGINKIQHARKIGFDSKEWYKLHHKHNQEYIRKRLKFIKLVLTTELTSQEICAKLNISTQFYDWLGMFLGNGLVGLCRSSTRKIPNRISDAQKLELKEIILNSTPVEHGIDRNIWTAEVIIELLKTKWNIDYKDSRVYQILNELGLTHQKAHRDYANSDKSLSIDRRENMEKKLQIQG